MGGGSRACDDEGGGAGGGRGRGGGRPEGGGRTFVPKEEEVVKGRKADHWVEHVTV